MIVWLCLFAAILTALYLTKAFLPALDRTTKLMISGFMILFIGAAMSIYLMIGSPHFHPKPPQAQMPMMGQADINAMVDGLAARLADNPDDPEGWTRLIRSRLVLGDIQGVIRDHSKMRDVFADRPDLIAQISEQSGFDAFAREAFKQQLPQE